MVGIEDCFAQPDVPCAVWDAEAFASFLEHTRGVPERHIQRLTRQPNIEQLRDAWDFQGALVMQWR